MSADRTSVTPARREALRRITLWAVAGTAGLSACAVNPGDYTAEDAPTWDARIDRLARRPSVAVVFGAGGPRGFAHIGVIKALEALGLDPDIVVGASVGAMVGALYAQRMSASDLEQIALDLNVTDFLGIGGERGVRGDPLAIERFVADRLPGLRLEQLQRRFAATAVAMPQQALVTFNRGNVGVAVRASSAMPGAFPPARIRGVDYIDGDELSPVPCSSARLMGADVVIAVDVSAHLSSTPKSAPPEWQARDRRRTAAIAAELQFADVHVHPNLGYYADVRTAYRRRCIAIGEASVHAQWKAIEAAIRRKESDRAASEGMRLVDQFLEHGKGHPR